MGECFLQEFIRLLPPPKGSGFPPMTTERILFMKKRADGRYAKQITIGIKNGKPVKKTVYGKTQKEVEQKYQELKRQIETGIRLDLSKCTVSQLMHEWYDTKIHPNIKENTKKRYKYFLNAMDNMIGDMKVTEIKKYHMEELVNKLLEAGNASAHERLQTLKKFFDYCVENDILLKNPCTGISIHYASKKKRRLTREELEKIDNCDLLRKDKAFLYTLRYTGMRIGELCALYVSDVDFNSMKISVNKTIVSTNKTIIQDTPKTSSGNRLVPISLKLYKPLKCYIDGLPEGQLLLFPSDVNTPVSLASAGNKLKRILKKCDIEDSEITPHYFRHNFISECYDAGIDIKVVQQWVGHSDIKTTLDIYTHLSEEKLETESNKINDFYDSQKEVNYNNDLFKNA